MARGENKLRPLRVCVCTSYSAAQEPRAPRHAEALARLGKNIEVTFVDCAPIGASQDTLATLRGQSNLEWRTHHFATRRSNPVRLAYNRLRHKIALGVFRTTGFVTASAFSTRVSGLEDILFELAADIYIGHNSDTLLVSYRAARRRDGALIFDSMEFHSEMGEGQTKTERSLIKALEKRILPQCALILASSDQVANALASQYGVELPLALYNVPRVEAELPRKSSDDFTLYWRNAVVGLSQRGLDDALVAMTKLPREITLHLQGRMPADGGAAVRSRIEKLGLTDRVFFHPPYDPDDAVREAAAYTIGLCLERKGCRNHDLTVSNKIFDYHMGGLAVIASDLPGLRGVIERSEGGLLFEPGSSDDLVEKICRLHRDPSLRKRLAANARDFALREANRESEMEKFISAFERVTSSLRHRYV